MNERNKLEKVPEHDRKAGSLTFIIQLMIFSVNGLYYYIVVLAVFCVFCVAAEPKEIPDLCSCGENAIVMDMNAIISYL